MSSRLAQFRAVLSLGLAAACGGGEDPKGAATSAALPAKAAPKIDACALLTPEEIEAAVGWKSVKAEPSAYGGTAVCNYYGPKGMTQSVSLLVAPRHAGVTSSTEMAEWRK